MYIIRNATLPAILLIGAFLFTGVAFAAGSITVSGSTVGQPFTMTATITNHSCGTDRDGKPTDETFQVSDVTYLIWQIDSGKYATDTQAGITVTKNGQQIAGHRGPEDRWYPDGQFDYHTGDIVVVTVSHLIAPQTGRYTAIVMLTQPNSNQCISVGGVVSNGVFQYYFPFTGGSAAASSPIPVPSASPTFKIEPTSPQPSLTSVTNPGNQYESPPQRDRKLPRQSWIASMIRMLYDWLDVILYKRDT